METKQIIAILAVAVVAIAGIGAAYAYSATLTNQDNSASANYLSMQVEGATYESYYGTFSDDALKFDADTTWAPFKAGVAAHQQIVFTPTGATEVQALDNLVALPVGNPLTISIDSTLMEEGNYYTFSVNTKVPDQSGGMQDFILASDDSKAYAIQYTVQKGDDTSTVVSNWKYMDQATEDLFIADYISADNKHMNITVQLYAMQVFAPEIGAVAPKAYSDVDFIFKAQASDSAVTTSGLTVTVQDYKAQAIDDADIKVFTSAGALCVVTPATNVYTLPSAAGYTAQAYKEGYAFHSQPADISAGDGSIAIKESVQSIAISTQPTVAFDGYKVGDTFSLAGLVIVPTYHEAAEAVTYGAESGIGYTPNPNMNVAGTTDGAVTYTVDGVTVYLEQKVVVHPAATGAHIQLNGHNITAASVAVNATITLKAVVDPDGAIQKGTWSSSDGAKATIADGVVTGVAAGTTTITFTPEDTSATAVSIELTVQ